MRQISEQQYRNNLHYIDSIKEVVESEDVTIYYGYSNLKTNPVSMIKKIRREYLKSIYYIRKFYCEN